MFWTRVNKDDPAGHWLWTGCISRGYGEVRTRRSPTASGSRRAHRVAWELVNGPIPDELVIDHLCRVKRCVNPDHLEPVTQAENVRRGLKGVLAPQPERTQQIPVVRPGQRVVDTASFVARRFELYSSRTRFCRAADVSVAYVKLIENGTHQPSRRVARALAEALKWEVEQLYLPAEAADEGAAA